MAHSFEKFCLKWNDFQQNIISYYHDLRKDSGFSDVTLVCEEDQQIEAHRIILSACSPFFNTVLTRNKHSHPMIYMKGVEAKDMVAIVDFIYLGEANIYQEDLDAFLALADDLKLKGLVGAKDDSVNEDQEKRKEPRQLKAQRDTIYEQEENTHEAKKFKEKYTKITNTYEDDLIVPVYAGKLHVPIDTNKEDLKVQLESMMVRSEDGEIKMICTVCGKAFKGKDWGSAKFTTRRHIETHMDGLSYPCNQCGKVSR